MYQQLNKRILILSNKSFDIESSTSDLDSSLILSLEENGFKVDIFTDLSQVLQIFSDGIYCMMIILMRLTKNEAFSLFNKVKNIDKRIRICFLND